MFIIVFIENVDAYGYYDGTGLLLPEGERNPDYTNGTITQMSLTLAPPLLPYDDFERPIYYSPNSTRSTNDVIDQSKHLHHQYGTTRPTRYQLIVGHHC